MTKIEIHKSFKNHDIAVVNLGEKLDRLNKKLDSWVVPAVPRDSELQSIEKELTKAEDEVFHEFDKLFGKTKAKVDACRQFLAIYDAGKASINTVKPEMEPKENP